jgi:Cu/Ag efflux pump CusA
LQVGSLFEDQKVFDVVVWGVPDVRSSVSAIRELLIDTPSGQHVRLSDVAAVRIGATPSVIKRNSVSQYIDITFAVTGRDMEAIAADLRNAIQGVTFDLEYHAEVLGSYADTATMLRRVQLATVMAIVGIVLLLQAAFDNWRMAVVAALCLPLALSGGVLAAYATGITISLGALAGLLALFGLAVRAGVALVTRCIYLHEHERVVFGQGLVALGARDMLKSFVIVLLATAALFLPVLAFGGIAGQELLLPMAIVMLGGLLSTAIYALLIVPAVYLRFGQRTAVRIAEEPVFGQGLQPTD